ncbi:MAG TPA: hypothetical protein DCW72_10925 [Elusimicrobia bacterium]|nr:MAG: hypothetical protein A2X29_10255 [Elusimicrobia bacterium GWA2_64_40]HAU90690.1 hypothetical protein [Elusimicrobiota bacterium]
MEKGLKLGPGAFRDKTALRRSLKAFDWAYFGPEFCENLLEPGLLEGLRVLSGERKNVCLLTPMVTDKGLAALEGLFSAVRKLRFKGRFEVSVNDFGVLDLIRRKRWDVRVNFGRQLARNFVLVGRDSVNILNQSGLALLEELKVGRLETALFSRPPGPRLSGPAGALRFTAFYPYLDVTVTRTCLAGMPEVSPYDSPEGVRCARECLNAAYRVGSDRIKEDMIVGGNTIFVDSGGPVTAAMGKSLGVDRLVFCPDT